MQITDLSKIKKKIDAINKYLGVITSLEQKELVEADRKELVTYKRLLEVNLRGEQEGYQIIQDYCVAEVQNASSTDDLSPAEKEFMRTIEATLSPQERRQREKVLQTLEAMTQQCEDQAQEASTEMEKQLRKVDGILENLLYDTFMNIEKMKGGYK